MEAAPAALTVAAACVFALMLAHGVANRLSALFDPPAMSACTWTPRTAPRPRRPRRALSSEWWPTCSARVPPGEPIYVAPRRSDLVAYSNSIVYVLAERDNAARRDFGLLTGAAEQQAIVDQLRAHRPRVVVRWTDPLSSKAEPNLRGRSSGVRTLDTYLSSDYRLLERLYHYDVLVPR